MPHKPELNRCTLLRAAAAASLASDLGSRVAHISAAPCSTPISTLARPDLIRHKGGATKTLDWVATNVRIDPKSNYRSPWIEGCAPRTSVRPGESIALHVSTNPALPFAIDVHRRTTSRAPTSGSASDRSPAGYSPTRRSAPCDLASSSGNPA